jgi:hypothetical protein
MHVAGSEIVGNVSEDAECDKRGAGPESDWSMKADAVGHAGIMDAVGARQAIVERGYGAVFVVQK